jgi:hypothetical protein
MALATQGPLKELYFGFNIRTLFVRGLYAPGAGRPGRRRALRLGFAEPAGYSVLERRPAEPGAVAELLHNGEPVPNAALCQELLGVEQIVELAIPSIVWD